MLLRQKTLHVKKHRISFFCENFVYYYFFKGSVMKALAYSKVVACFCMCMSPFSMFMLCP